MPAVEINVEDIIFDPKVQNYCNNSKFKCPNYGHSWACPPEAPYLEENVSRYEKFFLIYYEFNLKEYVERNKLEFPKRSEEKIRNSFYHKDIVRDYLAKEIITFLQNYSESYNEKFILWDGYCRICFKEGKNCTYDDGIPCRYPDKKRFSMEAVGIDVDKTVKSVDIEIEWPPINYAYRFGLICYI